MSSHPKAEPRSHDAPMHQRDQRGDDRCEFTADRYCDKSKGIAAVSEPNHCNWQEGKPDKIGIQRITGIRSGYSEYGRPRLCDTNALQKSQPGYDVCSFRVASTK